MTTQTPSFHAVDGSQLYTPVPGIQGPKGDKGDTGPQGADGPQGIQGPVGATGPQGPQGDPGATGATGAAGRTILSGTVAPTGADGVDGDFYINTTTETIYGPKAGGAWPSGVSLIGPTGPSGPSVSDGDKGDVVVSGSGATWTIEAATAAQVQAGTAGRFVAADKLIAAAAPQTLTDAATVNWDMSLGYNAKVTLGGNRTLAVSNPAVGMTYCLGVIQDGTGSRTMTWPASFDWGTIGAPTLTTTASKRDRITLFCTDAVTPKFDAFLSGKGFS